VRRALAACALAGAVAGCGGGHPAKTVTETTATRTEVVTTVTRRTGSFNPEGIYRAAAPGVVTIIAFTGTSRNALGRESAAVGSGFITDAAGYIATNAHVVTDDSNKRADAVYAEFADGNRVAAQIVGTDPNSDVALLKIDPSLLRGRAAKLDPLPLGSTARVQVGDPVVAIGSPFGEQQSLSTGVVSALNRDIESLTRYPIGNAIQTDAAINHGNSGGPLLDARGRVIGINSQIRSTGGGGEGVGFAIPIETIKRSLGRLRAKGHVDYAYLGISTLALYPQLAEHLHVPALGGALVDDVVPGSPADKAGLRGARRHITFQGEPQVPVGSDVVVAIGGERIGGGDDLSDIVARHNPGDTVSFTVIREGKRRNIAVTLGTRPGR
jgi:2-alkenal reductase